MLTKKFCLDHRNKLHKEKKMWKSSGKQRDKGNYQKEIRSENIR